MSDIFFEWSAPVFLPAADFFVHGDEANDQRGRTGIGLSCCRQRGTRAGKNAAAVPRPKKGARNELLTQKRELKAELKIRRRTSAAGKDDLQMFHGLPQRISVRTDGRRLLAAESRP